MKCYYHEFLVATFKLISSNFILTSPQYDTVSVPVDTVRLYLLILESLLEIRMTTEKRFETG